MQTQVRHIDLSLSLSNCLLLALTDGVLGAEVMKRLVDLEKSAEDMKATADKIQRQQKLFNKHDTNSSGEIERFEELKLVVVVVGTRGDTYY